MYFVDNEIAQLRIKKAIEDARKAGKNEVKAMREEISRMRREIYAAKARRKVLNQDSLNSSLNVSSDFDDMDYVEPRSSKVVESSVFTDPNFSSEMTTAVSSALMTALGGANYSLTNPDLFRSSLRFDLDRMNHTLSEILNELRRR